MNAGISPNFVRWLALSIARMPDDRISSLIAKQLDDELGNGKAEKIHRVLLERFVAGLEPWSPKEPARRVLEAGHRLAERASEVFDTGAPFEAIGGLIVAEIFAKKMDQCLGNEIRRQSLVPREALVWLDIHEVLEVNHAADSYELAVLVPEDGVGAELRLAGGAQTVGGHVGVSGRRARRSARRAAGVNRTDGSATGAGTARALEVDAPQRTGIARLVQPASETDHLVTGRRSGGPAFAEPRAPAVGVHPRGPRLVRGQRLRGRPPTRHPPPVTAAHAPPQPAQPLAGGRKLRGRLSAALPKRRVSPRRRPRPRTPGPPSGLRSVERSRERRSTPTGTREKLMSRSVTAIEKSTMCGLRAHSACTSPAEESRPAP